MCSAKKIGLITVNRFLSSASEVHQATDIESMADAQLPFAACLEVLSQRVPQHLKQPKVGIICGSGLSTLAASLTGTVHVPYGEIPGFGISTGAILSGIRPHRKVKNSYAIVVQGHKSSLVFGLSGDVPVVAMLGRVRDRGIPYHIDPPSSFD